MPAGGPIRGTMEPVPLLALRGEPPPPRTAPVKGPPGSGEVTGEPSHQIGRGGNPRDGAEARPLGSRPQESPAGGTQTHKRVSSRTAPLQQRVGARREIKQHRTEAPGASGDARGAREATTVKGRNTRKLCNQARIARPIAQPEEGA